ncbi:potassium transporter Kup [Pelagibacterium luteolum]|uniref:Probable potassium transport system protein Kup n=1 Tax=Pelagibacterium luteolum TaxID=440168 RepID=A0A1G7UGV3_9HYPH|nr:potassium transporter Kup [Pelagibacterium luteolum]SDG46786.1 KUP system potassium uptake protein [Pelagibacterium luteolum]
MTQVSSVGVPASHEAADTAHRASKFPLLLIGAIGVVFGDIGTSPIYAFREALAASEGAQPPEMVVLGLLSLIVWILTLSVAVKYALFVTRADNGGEGGTLSLVALARKTYTKAPFWITGLGVLGAALFYGDAMLTPAISVLSAVEGIELVAPNLTRFVIPITLAIIVGLFLVQKFGTGKVGAAFGPITAVWFLVLGISGLWQVIENPEVLAALNPYYAIAFLVAHPELAVVVMGAAFLAITGAEALYADMGHFGRRPIVVGWFALVFPCLVLNYFGQGAYVLAVGVDAVESPFYEMHPDWTLLPLIGLTTVATVIASQAVITGAYSLTQQAMAMDLLPRMVVQHTSDTESGQIYLPQINTALMVAVIIMVLAFGSSAALSAAYGVAVSGIMVVTLALLLVIMRRRWKWPLGAVIAFGAVFAVLDVGFFAVNASKFNDGGWVPMAVAAVLTLLMLIWMRGRNRLATKTRRSELPLMTLLSSLKSRDRTIVPGTAVFLTADEASAPTALLHSLKHYKVLHEHNVILTVRTASMPRVPDDAKVQYSGYDERFSRMVMTFGYRETPNVPVTLGLARKLGFDYDVMNTSFFLSRRRLKLAQKLGAIQNLEDRVFSAMAHNASDATAHFHLPTGRVVEIGMQVGY